MLWLIDHYLFLPVSSQKQQHLNKLPLKFKDEFLTNMHFN